jgi:amino acid transporter
MARAKSTAISFVMALSALLAVVVALANYFVPGNGISGTPGALLVVASSALLAGVGYLSGRRIAAGQTGGAALLLIALFLLAGTAVAAWLLEAYVLFALMMLAGLGWIVLAVRPRAA